MASFSKAGISKGHIEHNRQKEAHKDDDVALQFHFIEVAENGSRV